MTATLHRRKEVLALARREHNFLILEGAPPPLLTGNAARQTDRLIRAAQTTPYFYLYYGAAARYPSYFALELEEPEVGRVLRFDSLSKILSAGIRIGFASGPEPLLAAIDKSCKHHPPSPRRSSILDRADNHILYARMDRLRRRTYRRPR